MTAPPNLISRAQADHLPCSWDRTDEAQSPFWHNEVVPRVGGRVLLCARVPNGYGWFWGAVRAVLRWRVQVEMPGAGPPGSGLALGDTFTVDPEETVHVTLADEAAETAYSAWYRAWRESSKKPAADAADTKEKSSEL